MSIATLCIGLMIATAVKPEIWEGDFFLPFLVLLTVVYCVAYDVLSLRAREE